MPEITEHSPGSFCWVDQGTTDLEKAKAFYAALFGWDYAAVDESGYTMCLRGRRPEPAVIPCKRSPVLVYSLKLCRPCGERVDGHDP